MQVGKVLHILNTVEIVSKVSLITVSAGPQKDPIILVSEQSPGDRVQQSEVSCFPKKDLYHFQIYHQMNGEFTVISLPETSENFRFVQPIGQNQYLLVRANAKSESDKNAHIYNAEGWLVRSFHAGDGIQDVQVTEAGQIWIGFSDEGVFGDLELGQSGVVCLDEEGHPIFKYDAIAAQNGLLFMDDCYAINVAAHNEVWFYYYSDFPLVRLINRRFDCQWRNIPVTGSHGFAATKEQALFAGSYHKRDWLFLVSLDTMEVKALQPVDSNGKPIAFEAAFGRGSRLYLVTQRALLALDLNETDQPS